MGSWRALRPERLLTRARAPGSVESLLKVGRLSTLYQKIVMLEQSSAGLSHMHSVHVIHRDVALRNILLRGDDHAMVADLGMARTVISGDYVMMAPRALPYRWMAPVGLLPCGSSHEPQARRAHRRPC